MNDACAHLLISGRVQGVWYRGSTKDEARRLGLTGWVRNLADGRVEARVCGSREQVETLIQWCHQGPPAAKVSEVQVSWEEAEETFTVFKIR